MKLSRALRSLSEGLTEAKVVGHVELLTEAADLLDATTPRPWPPPDGVRKCLAWRNKDEGWFTIAIEPELLTDEYIWRGCGVIAVNRFPPKFWLPMPPAPEVGP